MCLRNPTTPREAPCVCEYDVSPDVPDGSIIITPAEVYADVKSLTDQVRTLLARDEAEREDRDRDRSRLDAVESRLSKVEQKVWLASGACAAVGAVAGVIAPTLFHG